MASSFSLILLFHGSFRVELLSRFGRTEEVLREVVVP